jgi:hypothetical protein
MKRAYGVKGKVNIKQAGQLRLNFGTYVDHRIRLHGAS